MQYIDDDMDELFRKAAEYYPLNTNSGDLNEVLKKIATNDPEKITPVNKKKYTRLLLLLLLLPLSWIGYQYFNSHNQNGKNVFADKHVSKNIVAPLTQSNTSLAENKNTTTQENKKIQPPTVIQVMPGYSHKFIQPLKINIVHKQSTKVQSLQSAPETNNTLSDRPVTILQDGNKKEMIPKNINNANEVTAKTGNENITKALPENDKKENDQNPVTTKTKNKKQKTEHGMYAGIYISPDISTVKLQSVKNTGITIGMLIGYQFNKKISVETGLAWNKKYYYSDGKYFNPKNITLPAYAQIVKLDGVCKMIEVPVTIKYNLRSSVKTNVSISGGVSSYFMKSERYNYTINHNGQQYPRNASYKNSSTNLLAVATVGFGYNHSLGRGAMLRLEPYLKIPVTGVGIGKLPIMSTGINIGVTKKLF